VPQIVPFEVGVIASQDSNFIVLEFADRSPAVFVERLQDGAVLRDEPSVQRYREAIDHLRDSALTIDETNARLVQVRKTYASTVR
jgi:hypothetical protein